MKLLKIINKYLVIMSLLLHSLFVFSFRIRVSPKIVLVGYRNLLKTRSLEKLAKKKSDSESNENVINTINNNITSPLQTSSSAIQINVRDAKQVSSSNRNEKIESIIRDIMLTQRLSIYKIDWFHDRIEITLEGKFKDAVDVSEQSLTNHLDEINVDMIAIAHSTLVGELESSNETDFLQNYEIIMASKGVSDVLIYDRDFKSFQGFVVIVRSSNETTGDVEQQGTLVERNENFVIISQRGKKCKIPRASIIEVRLPKAKFEPTDLEMRKLQ